MGIDYKQSFRNFTKMLRRDAARYWDVMLVNVSYAELNAGEPREIYSFTFCIFTRVEQLFFRNHAVATEMIEQMWSRAQRSFRPSQIRPKGARSL
jgi:hypothetical protein